MKTVGVIPARLGSTRLQEKVLQPLQGKPLIQHVWERVRRADKLVDVIVACDDERVKQCVEGFGGRAVMTRRDHPNGSSRVAEIASKEDASVFINIQGDEPLIDPRGINQLVGAFEKDSELQVATLAVRKNDPEEFRNPNAVKVVCDASGNALYFSRSPIPFRRDTSDRDCEYLKHLGIYGYQKNFLLQFIAWEPGLLEETEKLEQLRILEKGIPIRVVETESDSVSVDTAHDLEVVEAILKGSYCQKSKGP